MMISRKQVRFSTVSELVVYGQADDCVINTNGAFAASAVYRLDDDGLVEIVNIFQGSEVEMALRYRQEQLPKPLA